MFHQEILLTTPSTHAAFASNSTFHNNIYNVEKIPWHIQKGEHEYEEYLRMF
jgi:hypothetical protein